MAIKAREIRVRLQGKVDPELIRVLEAIVEHQSVLREQVLDCATQITHCADILVKIIGSADEMLKTVETQDRVKGKEHETDEHD